MTDVTVVPDALHAEARHVGEVVHLRQRAQLGGRRSGHRLPDRVLTGCLESAGEPQHVGASDPVRRHHAVQSGSHAQSDDA